MSTRVMLWGDSLAWESQDYFKAALLASGRRVDVQTHTFGGTAICDYLADIDNVARSWKPRIAVLEFSGNTFSSCSRRGPREEVYKADVVSAVKLLRHSGTQVILASAPLWRDSPGSPDGLSPIGRLYKDIAEVEAGVTFAPAGEAVMDAHRYTKTLPCLPDEDCSGGRQVVRAPDGIHFCPVSGPRPQGKLCAVYSSGSRRYAQAITKGVLAILAR